MVFCQVSNEVQENWCVVRKTFILHPSDMVTLSKNSHHHLRWLQFCLSIWASLAFLQAAISHHSWRIFGKYILITYRSVLGCDAPTMGSISGASPTFEDFLMPLCVLCRSCVGVRVVAFVL